MCLPPLTSDHWRTSATDATCLSVWKPSISAPVSRVLINVLLCGAIHSYRNFSGRGTAAIAGGGGQAAACWSCYGVIIRLIIAPWAVLCSPSSCQQQQADTAGCGVRSSFSVISRVSEMAAFLISILCTFCLKSYLRNEHTALSSIAALFHCGGRRGRSWV